MGPDFIRQILEAGGNIELEGTYAPAFITQWVQIVVAKGGHLTVSGGYAPSFVIEWARAGGNHFTYRVKAPA